MEGSLCVIGDDDDDDDNLNIGHGMSPLVRFVPMMFSSLCGSLYVSYSSWSICKNLLCSAVLICCPEMLQPVGSVMLYCFFNTLFSNFLSNTFSLLSVRQ